MATKCSPDSIGLLSPIAGNASVYQLDNYKVNTIIMPALRKIAENPELLEKIRARRFNRDEPPPYRSPTPDSHEYDNIVPLSFTTSDRDRILAEIEELVSEPLSEEELRETQQNFELWHSAYRPGNRYVAEAKDADFSLMNDEGLRDLRIREWLAGRAGEQRRKVVFRHRIKKRWERLGVWNPEWGIPGRVNEGPRDNPSSWKWTWQGDMSNVGADCNPYRPHHPNSRAVHLREGLRRGQRVPLQPQCNLATDASRTAAESFITSRPWYTYALDQEEERTRLNRIPWTLERFYDKNHTKPVATRWKETGDLDSVLYGHGWKWKHESPSPEPEALGSIEYTPSELDALEAIPPPTPPPPPPPPRPPLDLTKWRKIPDQTSVYGYRLEKVPSPELEGSASVYSPSPSPSPPQLQPRPKLERLPRQLNGQKAKAPSGDDGQNAPKLRRSPRIAEGARQAETTVVDPQTVKITSRKRSVPNERAKPEATTTTRAHMTRPSPDERRMTAAKALVGKTASPQGIIKKRGISRT
ncbi:hypothetical protein B0T24DRAFT_108889 [Lasiosphaeria ovina]|uniref:Uncharacterized protein n=1 Tax=Lasiosphaeria ovina TaxID=92902 RepID=A0AAE0JTA8_9PEZI|nr:hypothetical protein B0T24DRAFT_108889 [Lasiosphaeria ovina]